MADVSGNTLLMAVAERTREIGVLRALGASRGDVFRLVWLEAIPICAAGAAFGLGAALALSFWMEQWLRRQLPFTPSGQFVHWEWRTAALSVAAAATLGGLAALLPAWRAAWVAPIEAIRRRRAAW